MTPARATTYCVGALLLAGWLASAAGVPRAHVPRVPRRSPESMRLDSVVSNVQSQASRLRQRIADAPAPQPAVRNPFAFVTGSTPGSAPAARPPALQPAAAANQPLPEPDLALIGIAEEGATRTAMIAAGDELLMATEGQVLGGRYRVAKVGTDALELVDLATGATRRLFLRSPASLL